MGKNNILFGIIGLIVGLVIGFWGANYLNKTSPNPSVAQNQIQNPNGVPPQANPQGQTSQGNMLPDVQKVLDKAQNEPNNYEAQIKAGEMYAQIQRADKALEFYQKAQKLKPNEFEANASLANAFFDSRQFENAETYYLKALEIKSNDVNVLTDLGTTFVERNNPDFDKAIEYFNKALEIKSDHEPTLYNLGIAYLRKGEKENAQKALEKLKEATPNSQLISRLEQIINKN